MAPIYVCYFGEVSKPPLVSIDKRKEGENVFVSGQLSIDYVEKKKTNNHAVLINKFADLLDVSAQK